MTAKRYRVFKYYDGSGMWGISDDTAEYTVAYFDNHFEAENLCKVLNDLYEETQAQSIVIREYQNRCDNLHEENKEIQKKMNRLYNYFEDFFSDVMGNDDFAEQWEFVADDEKWD